MEPGAFVKPGPVRSHVSKEKALADKLAPGDQFPDMSLALTGGGTFNVPGDFNANYGIVLFYRGHW